MQELQGVKMKVKELIEKLSKLDRELTVVVSSDAEGNDYSLLANESYDFEENQVYVPGYGLFWGTLTEKLEAEGYSEEDTYAGEDGIRCVVLYPE